MRKKLLIGLSILALFVFVSAAFCEEVLKVKGTVSKIDAASKSVTIQPKDGDAVTVVYDDGDLLDKVKEGGKGEAKYVVKDGKNAGTKLRKLTAGCE